MPTSQTAKKAVNGILMFLLKKQTIIVIYLLIAIVAALKQYLHGSYNNYLIFKYVFWHTVWEKPLYELSPLEYLDSNHYGPLFSLIIAPFALLPDWLGGLLWNMANVAVLLVGIFKLPLSLRNKIIIAWIAAHECLTALLSFQFNVAITGLILLAFSYMERKKSMKAAFAMVLAFLIKLYGIVALAFFLFNKDKAGFFKWSLILFILLFCLPMAISSPEFIVKGYQDWFSSLFYKSLDNEVNVMADISFLGFIRKTTGLHINVLYGCAFAGLILIAILLRTKMYAFIQYRLLVLCYVLLCLVLFNTNVESPTYIIGFLGVAIWYMVVEKTNYTLFLLVFAIVLTSFSPSDLFPKFIRQQYIIPYALKALPCILIWFDLAYRLIAVEFKENLKYGK